MITWQHDSKTYALPDEWYWRNIDLDPNDFLAAVINNFSFIDLNQSFNMGLGKSLEDIIILEDGEEIIPSDMPTELEDFYEEL